MPWYRMRIDLGGPLAGAFHLNFGRAGNKRAPDPCSVCGWFGERQCDWKLERGTCDRWLCQYCSTPRPGDRDLCPEHELAARAWLAGRTNSTDGAGP